MRNARILFFILLLLCSFKSVANTASDNDISEKILIKIADDPMIAKFKIGVETTTGLVKLSGEVDTVQHAARLVETAESIQGVYDVMIPNLVIAGSIQGLDDAIIAAKIMGTYLRNKMFGDVGIDQLPVMVSSYNGLVFLDGVVDNRGQFLSSIKIAQGMRGVNRVISRLNIRFVSVTIP